jgi:hypothetical protein
VLQQADSGLLANRPIFDWSWRALLFWQPVGTFLSFPDRGDVWIALLCLLLLVTSCLALLRSHLSEGSSWRRDVVLLFVSTAFVLYLLSPDSLSGGWSHGRLRMLHLMVLISLPTLTIVPRGLVRRVLIAGMGLVLIVNLSGIWSNYRSFQQGATDFVALASALPPGQLLLTLDLESPPDDRIRPGLHLWSYVCIERDCLSPFLFANRYAQNLYFVRMPEWPPEGALTPSDWRAIIRLLDRGDYDGVLLHGRSEEGEAVLASVLDTVAESPAGALYLRSSARERPGRH